MTGTSKQDAWEPFSVRPVCLYLSQNGVGYFLVKLSKSITFLMPPTLPETTSLNESMG